MKKLIVQFAKFALVGGVGVAINEATLLALTNLLGIPYYYSNLGAIAVATIWNFLGYRAWAFKP
jgi:putative flippase GtrA